MSVCVFFGVWGGSGGVSERVVFWIMTFHQLHGGSHWMKARREFDVLKESGDFLFVSQCFKNISFDVWIESGDLFFWSQCVKLFHFCAHV